MKKTIITPLVASALLLASIATASAAVSNRTFNGAVSNLWSDAGNWSNSAVPASTDDAPRLSMGKSVVLSVSASTVGNIYLGGSASYLNNSLSIQDGGSLSCGTIYMSTGSVMNQTSTLIVQNGSTLSSAAIYITTTGSSNKTGYLTVAGNSVLTSSGNLYVSGMGGTTNSGTLTVQNNATVACGALYITTNSSNSGSVFLQNGATLSAGSVYVTSGSGNTGTLQLQSNATMTSSAIYIASGGSGNTGSMLIQGSSLNSGSIFIAATGSNQVASISMGAGSNVVAGGNGLLLATGTDAVNSVARAKIEGNAFYEGAITIGCTSSNPSGSSAIMTFSGANFTATTSSANYFKIGQNGTAVFQLGATGFGTIYYSGVSFSVGSSLIIDGSDFTAERTSDINVALLIYRNSPSDVSGLTITFTNFDESYGDLTVADNITWVKPTGTIGQEGYQEGYLLLHISAIPEPALAGLLVGALAVTFAVRRRRQS